LFLNADIKKPPLNDAEEYVSNKRQKIGFIAPLSYAGTNRIRYEGQKLVSSISALAQKCAFAPLAINYVNVSFITIEQWAGFVNLKFTRISVNLFGCLSKIYFQKLILGFDFY